MSRDRKLGLIVTVLGISSMFMVIWAANLFAKELPALVPIEEIAQYNEQRVTVFGWVRSVEQKRGRLGSNFLEITIGEGESEIKAYSTFPIYNILDHRVIVQGVYRESGRFAGLLAANFINAEAIINDWGEAKK